jgi:hypothetical protein
MTKKTQLARIAIHAVALAVGGALLAAPALAQNSGRNINDGGIPAEPPAALVSASKQKTSAVTAQQPVSYGRSVDDGGLPPEPTAAAKSAAAKTNTKSQVAAKPAAPASARNPNDGGAILTEQ